MAGSIDMVNDAVSLGRSPERMVQSGGGGAIEMYGGDGVSLGHTPTGSVQTGGGKGSTDWVGPTDLLNKGETSPYGSKFPSDKGE